MQLFPPMSALNDFKTKTRKPTLFVANVLLKDFIMKNASYVSLSQIITVASYNVDNKCSSNYTYIIGDSHSSLTYLLSVFFSNIKSQKRDITILNKGVTFEPYMQRLLTRIISSLFILNEQN